MSDIFCLTTAILDGKRVIHFANKSDTFIEVIFTIDGREVKNGNTFTSAIRGYGYPPKLERPVKSMHDGKPLPFRRGGGEVRAYIFTGNGGYRDDILNIPPFMRNRVATRIKFKRKESEAAIILRCPY